MRRAMCLLVLVLGLSCCASLGQNTPKFSTPRIVATFERIGLTAALPATTIYTPKAWGTFRISVVMVTTVPNGESGSWFGLLQTVDGAGKKGLCDCGTLLATRKPNTESSVYAVRAYRETPLNFSVTPETNTGGSKYNVFVVVEQLM